MSEDNYKKSRVIEEDLALASDEILGLKTPFYQKYYTKLEEHMLAI